MTMQHVEAKSSDSETALRNDIRSIVSDVTDHAPPSDDTDLIESGLLDSLALVELIMELEQFFAIEVPFDQLEVDDFRTIAGIESLVRAQRDNARQGA